MFKLTMEALPMSVNADVFVSTKGYLRHVVMWRKAKVGFLAVLNNNVNVYVYIVTLTTNRCQVDSKMSS